MIKEHKTDHFVITITPNMNDLKLLRFTDKENHIFLKEFLKEIHKYFNSVFSVSKRLKSSYSAIIFIKEKFDDEKLNKILRLFQKLKTRIKRYPLFNEGEPLIMGIDCDNIFWDAQSNDDFLTSRAIDASVKMANIKTGNVFIGQRAFMKIKQKNALTKVGTIIKGINYSYYCVNNYDKYNNYDDIAIFNEDIFHYRSHEDMTTQEMTFAFIDIVGSSRLLYLYDGKEVTKWKENIFSEITQLLDNHSFQWSYRGDGLMIWKLDMNNQTLIDLMVLVIKINNLKTKFNEMEATFRSNRYQNSIPKNKFRFRSALDFTNGGYYLHQNKEPSSQHKTYVELMINKIPIGTVYISKNFTDSLCLDSFHIHTTAVTIGNLSSYQMKEKIWIRDIESSEATKKMVSGSYRKKFEVLQSGHDIYFNYQKGDQVKNNGPNAHGNSSALREAQEKNEWLSFNGYHYYIRKYNYLPVIINDKKPKKIIDAC